MIRLLVTCSFLLVTSLTTAANTCGQIDERMAIAPLFAVPFVFNDVDVTRHHSATWRNQIAL